MVQHWKDIEQKEREQEETIGIWAGDIDRY